MIFVYPAIFHKDTDSFWVEFPDLEGCQSFGDTLNETVEAAQEALSGYLLTMLEEGREINSPSDISSLSISESDCFPSLVSCELNPYKDMKAVKKTLSIPSWLNERATAMGINFSQVLQEALMAKMLKQ